MPIMVMFKQIPVQVVLTDDFLPEDDVAMVDLTQSPLLIGTTMEKKHQVVIFRDAVAFLEKMSMADYQEYRNQQLAYKFGRGLGSEKLS